MLMRVARSLCSCPRRPFRLRLTGTECNNSKAAGSPTASPSCRKLSALAGSAPALPEIHSFTPEAVVADAVTSFLTLDPAAQLSVLQRLPSPHQVHQLLYKVAASSKDILPLIYAIRLVVGGKDASKLEWCRKLDESVVQVLKTFCGPAFIHIDQLSCSPYAPPHLRKLADAAKHAETVHKTDNHIEYLIKYGRRRLVHAAYSVLQPDALLGVLYTALLPRMPASMEDINNSSGGPPSAVGMWSIDGSPNAGCRKDALGSLQPSPTPPPPGEGEGVEAPTTAVFYSVSTPHEGMRGIRMGTRIIYAVAASVAATAPALTNFVTLSPIPGFVEWLRSSTGQAAAEQSHGHGDIDKANLKALGEGEGGAIRACAAVSGCGEAVPPGEELSLLCHLLQERQWFDNATSRELLHPVLVRLCRLYLLTPGTGPRGAPLCKVAGFHLGNGARLHRICWAADASNAGLARSAGLMVNYLYSDEGARGLQATIHVHAPEYAKQPREVLLRQQPLLA